MRRSNNEEKELPVQGTWHGNAEATEGRAGRLEPRKVVSAQWTAEPNRWTGFHHAAGGTVPDEVRGDEDHAVWVLSRLGENSRKYSSPPPRSI